MSHLQPRILQAIGDCPNPRCSNMPNHLNIVTMHQDHIDVSGFGSIQRSIPTKKDYELEFVCGCTYDVAATGHTVDGLTLLQHAFQCLRDGTMSAIPTLIENINGQTRARFLVSTTPGGVSDGLQAGTSFKVYARSITSGAAGPWTPIGTVKEPEPENVPVIPDGIEKLTSYRMFDLVETGRCLAIEVDLQQATAFMKGDKLVIEEPSFSEIREWKLKSTNHPVQWDREMTARCGGGGWSAWTHNDEDDPAHVAPMLNCKCGLYACDSIESLFKQGYGDRPVRATLKQWGKVCRGETGTIRSQYAEIVSLEVFDGRLPSDAEEIVEALKRTYGVPVTIVDRKAQPKDDYEDLSHYAAKLSGSVSSFGMSLKKAAKAFEKANAHLANYSNHMTHVHLASPGGHVMYDITPYSKMVEYGVRPKKDQNGAMRKNQDYLGLQKKDGKKWRKRHL